MEMVTFACPHCGNVLEAPSNMDGQTNSCPYCNGMVTLQVMTTKQAVTTGLVVGTIAVLAGLFGLDS